MNRRILGILLSVVILGGCGSSAPTTPVRTAGSGPTVAGTASSGTLANEMTPVSTSGWWDVGTYPFHVLIPGDWCENTNGSARVFNAGACGQGPYCEMSFDNGGTDSPDVVLEAWTTRALSNLNSMAGQPQWAIHSVIITGVPAAARMTGSDGSVRFVAAKPGKDGLVGVYVLECNPLPTDGVIAAILATASY